ncbi:MAG: hypothetical protein ACI8WB_003483 [Phenylobacterium sp.]|jgi:hypothetical protein
MQKIPITLPNGKSVYLAPGKHDQLQTDIIDEFCPCFVSEGSKLIYVGDKLNSEEDDRKAMFLTDEYLIKLGLQSISYDKLPDVVVYDEKRQWLFLIEAVTSNGFISSKRKFELEEAFADCLFGLVYITAFPDRAEFRKNAADIAWETEVWIADNPEHMIHFNGDRFLGPHSK